MDTKEKNREASRQNRPAQEPRRRPEGKTESSRKKQAAKTERRRPAREEAAQPRQRRERPATEKQPAAQTARRREQPAQEQQSRPVRQPASQSSRRTSGTTVQRPERTEGVTFTVPKGTGPRKSAPQPTAEETAAIRRQQRSRRSAAPKTAEKKNALQNLIAGVKGGTEATPDAAARAEQRRKDRAARAEKKRKSAQRHDTPAVIYTEPMAFSRDRLLIQLLTVTAVVAALVLGMSVFFKVKTITVSGADTYSEYSVLQASGITEGDNLLTFSKPKAAAKIQAELSYVDDVRIGIKLPDTVIIYIEEMDVAYAVESVQGDWWLINSEGRVVEQLDAGLYGNYTQVLGVMLEDPQVGNTAVAADEVPQETLSSGEPVPITVTGTQRLSSALQILKALEANDIVGQAASVNVSALDDVTLWYGTRYEVMLGDTTRMEYKIACMNDAILQMSDYQSGILDISFTHWADQVGYTPFG